MAKISNTAAYPSISNLDSADYLVLTDAENELKNFGESIITSHQFITFDWLADSETYL